MRELGHDHPSAQPFTRSVEVEIAGAVTEVGVQGRDQLNGRGGATVTVANPR